MTPDAHKALFRLDGRTAVVTGASRGIGHAIASALSLAGARTLGLARSASPESPFAGPVDYHAADASTDPDALLDALLGPAGALDILVCAAGISLPPAADPAGERARFDETLRLNLSSAYGLAEAASRRMPRGGAIILVASINARQGFPGNPGYVASKGALVSLARALAVDLGPRGVRVNALSPGYVRTAMTEASHADPERRAARAGRTALGRWGEVDDIAGPALFLASPASAYVTGAELVVDGGWTARGL
jgi:gluconate 5-dehydrogenase